MWEEVRSEEAQVPFSNHLGRVAALSKVFGNGFLVKGDS